MHKSGSDIRYHPLVVKKDIPKLASAVAIKIRSSIETKLTNRPEIYGQPLRGTLKRYRKLRVGDYRVVFEIRQRAILVLLIAHRKDVYNLASKRLAR